MLVTSTSTRRWILPKGYVEPNLTARESAEFEAYEEAGVAGAMATVSVGSYTYVKQDEKGNGRYRVKVFPLQVTRMFDDYPEAKKRSRKWMNIEAAVKAVSEPGLKEILRSFGRRHTVANAAE